MLTDLPCCKAAAPSCSALPCALSVPPSCPQALATGQKKQPPSAPPRSRLPIADAAPKPAQEVRPTQPARGRHWEASGSLATAFTRLRPCRRTGPQGQKGIVYERWGERAGQERTGISSSGGPVSPSHLMHLMENASSGKGWPPAVRQGGELIDRLLDFLQGMKSFI